jgi:hypothetical protein
VTAIMSRADFSSSQRADLDVLVEGPDVGGLSDTDVRRLFPGTTLTGARLNRLRNWPRVVVRIDDVPVGLATYTQTPFEMQIPDFAVSIPTVVRSERARLAERVLDALLDAIELASLAGGCNRIVLIPSVGGADLERRGYVVVREGCAGAWMEKSVA